jgi:hypothetical protein
MNFKKKRVMITSISRELNSILIPIFRADKNVAFQFRDSSGGSWRVNKASC